MCLRRVNLQVSSTKTHFYCPAPCWFTRRSNILLFIDLNVLSTKAHSKAHSKDDSHWMCFQIRIQFRISNKFGLIAVLCGHRTAWFAGNALEQHLEFSSTDPTWQVRKKNATKGQARVASWMPAHCYNTHSLIFIFSSYIQLHIVMFTNNCLDTGYWSIGPVLR